MVSAFTARLAISGLCGFAGVVRWGGQLGPRPFGQHAEATGDVVDDLPRVRKLRLTQRAGISLQDAANSLLGLINSLFGAN
jgi:hypothetical protein